MRESLTAVCRHCEKSFQLSIHSNRFHRKSRPVKATRFCSPACKQAAYRARAVTRNAKKPAEGTNGRRAVTRSSAPIDNTAEFSTQKTTLSLLWDTELWSRFPWEERISSDGVPIKVSRLASSILVRK